MFYGTKHGPYQDDVFFSKVYRRFRRPILHYVQTKVANLGAAEEVTQEVFMKVYRFQNSYEDKYAVSTWLWTIARNTISDYLRGVRGTINDGHGISSSETTTPTDELPSRLHTAETLMIKQDQRRTLFKMMKSLTRMQKRVLWMRIVQQRSYAEIAKVLGLSLSAAKNLAHRAKLTLTQNFGQMTALPFSEPTFPQLSEITG